MTALPASEGCEASGLRILHLEDSPIDAELVAAHLARSGLACEVRAVAARAAYAAALTEGGIDLILADYEVPGFDGLAALEMASELAPGVPFVFVSGALGEEAAVEAVRRGATDYVVKQRLARLPVAVMRSMAEARARAGQREALAALQESEARLAAALAAARLGTFEWNLRTDAVVLDERSREIFGFTPGEGSHAREVFERIHPDDFPRVRNEAQASEATLSRLETEYRIRLPDGTLRAVTSLSDAVPGADGRAERIIGVFADITERKRAEERQLLLMHEVDHRAKNALTVVQSMIRMTEANSLDAYMEALEGRIDALARAQTQLAFQQWDGADLRSLVAGELAPFLTANGMTQAELDGPKAIVPAEATQSLAMAVHELATNAAKHGALSSPGGRVTVTWLIEPGADNQVLRLRWAEFGGPPIEGEPERRGFGSVMVEETIVAQLGGRVTRHWKRTGLMCEVELPLGTDR